MNTFAIELMEIVNKPTRISLIVVIIQFYENICRVVQI